MQACEFCRVDHLAVAVVDGRTFVREGLARFLRENSGELAKSPPDPASLRRKLEEALEPLIFLGTGPAPQIPRDKEYTDFVEIDRGDPNLASLCGSRASKSASDVLGTVRRALCEPPNALPAAARANIRVRFRNGQTYCGNDRNVIACRADSELTEFNVRDYRFVLTASATTAIGAGPIPVNFSLVLLHEMDIGSVFRTSTEAKASWRNRSLKPDA